TRSDRDWSSDVCSSDLFEAATHWGGRIETETLRTSAGVPFSSRAEFGPMRFELGISPLLSKLLGRLGIDVGTFSPPLSPHIPIRSEERRVGKECRYRGE